MSEKVKKVREKIGDIFQIDLGDHAFGYGQVVSKSEYVFFDYFNEGGSIDAEHIRNCPVLFRITVDSYVIREKIWPIVANIKIAEENQHRNSKFTHDPHSLRLGAEIRVWV